MRLSRNAQKRGKFAKDLIKTKLGVVEFSVYSAVTSKKVAIATFFKSKIPGIRTKPVSLP